MKNLMPATLALLCLCATCVWADSGDKSHAARGFSGTLVDTAKDVSPQFQWDAQQARDKVKLIAARGEYRGFSVALRSAGEDISVRYTISDLTGPDDRRIPASAIQLNRCKFSAKPAYKGHYLEEISPPGPVDLNGDQVRWLWGTIHIPADAAPGAYSGMLSFRQGQAEPWPIRINIFVHDISLREDKGHWGFFMAGHLKDDHKRSYKTGNVAHKLSTQNIDNYFEFYKRYKLTSPFCFAVYPRMKLVGGKTAVASFDVASRFAKAMKKSGLAGDLCLELRKVGDWCSSVSLKVAELEKQGKPIPRELTVPKLALLEKDQTYPPLAIQLYKQVIGQLLATAKKEAWPKIQLIPEEEMANAWAYHKLQAYKAFTPILKELAPDSLMIIDNAIGHGRKNETEIEWGAIDNIPVRQYNSWTEAGLQKASRAGAEIRSYNYGRDRAAWGFEQERLHSNGHHQWADQWASRLFIRINNDKTVTSSVQLERIREGRFDYIYCNTLKVYIEQLQREGMPKQADALARSLRWLLADMPPIRQKFHYWRSQHTAHDLDNMRSFVAENINEARVLLGEEIVTPKVDYVPIPEFMGIAPAGTQTPLAQRTLSLSMPCIAESITLDGKLDEACWKGKDNSTGLLYWMRKKEAALRGFAGSEDELPRPHPAQAWAAYNRSGLYVASRCAGKSAPEHLAKGRKHGNDDLYLWRDDCTEFFFEESKTKDTYHLVVNPEGYTAISSESKLTIPSEGIAVATQNTEDGYTQEVLIPWRFFDRTQPPAAGTTWGANFGREFHTKKENVCWARTYKSFGDKREWGRLIFAGTSGDLRIHIDSDDLFPGKNIVSGTLSSASDRTLGRLNLTLTDQGGKQIECSPTLSSRPDGAVGFELACFLPAAKDTGALTIEVRNEAGGMLGELILPVGSAGKSVLIHTMPRLATSGEVLPLGVRVCMGNNEAAGRTLEGVLVSEDGETLKIEGIDLIGNGANTLLLGTSGLTPGVWSLRVWASGLGSEANSDRKEIRVLAGI